MNLPELILLFLSRSPQSEDYASSKCEWILANSLSLLKAEYSEFATLVSNERVVDFGCGEGYQSVALARDYDCCVVGIDSNQSTLIKAKELAKAYCIPQSRLCFADAISDDMLKSFDIVISQNSLEHFANPAMILKDMKSLLNESGRLLLTFGPPWFAPYGSHMRFFCKVPWINLLFSEETVLNVRRRFRTDGASKYEDVESGLNKMSVAKFERVIFSSDLKVEFKKYKCVKEINFLSRIPVLRELFINQVSVILSPAG